MKPMTLLALTLAAVLIAGHAADAPFCLPHKLMLGLFRTPDDDKPLFVIAPPGPADANGVRIQVITRTSPTPPATITLHLHPDGNACIGEGPPLEAKHDADPAHPFVCTKTDTARKGFHAMRLEPSRNAIHFPDGVTSHLYSRKLPNGMVRVLMVDDYPDGTSCFNVPIEDAHHFAP